MATRAGWTLVCPECYVKPGQYYGVFKLRSEKIDMKCPNCGTRLVEVERLKAQLAQADSLLLQREVR